MPRRPARPQGGDIARQTATAIRLLADPITPGALAERLGVSRRTVDRTLRAIEAAGFALEVEPRGIERYYRLRHSPR